MSTETKREPILNLTPEELAQRVATLGMPKFRTKQIQEWIFQKRATTFAEMTNLSLMDRKMLEEHFVIFTSQVVRTQTSADGTEKVLLGWGGEGGGEGLASRGEGSGGSSEVLGLEVQKEGEDGVSGQGSLVSLTVNAVETPEDDTLKRELQKGLQTELQTGTTEAVMIPCDDDMCDEYGNTTVAHRRTVCLSTQVGCPVGCAFCASGLDGLKGNLTAGQIIEEALRLQHTLPVERRLSNVVFMGMGEPLANFEATVQAIGALMAPWGFHISGRKITVSTVGLPPQMKRLADLGLPVTLAISLHAPNDELRKKIIPWAKKITLAQILDAAKYYFEKTGREVTLEYIMLDGKDGGVNTLPEHARQLAAIAKQIRANVNLIYYNEVPELPFKRPSGQTMFAFQTVLRAAGVNCHVRKSRGREIAAACGQLARQDKQERFISQKAH